MDSNINAAMRQLDSLVAGLRLQESDLTDAKEDDGIVMKQCKECKRLMVWEVGPYGARKCNFCQATYDVEEEVNYHMGYNKDTGHNVSQTGGPAAGLGAKKTQIAGLQIGHGKGALQFKRAQQFSMVRDNIDKLLLMWSRVLTESLIQLKINTNMDQIRNSVIRDIENIYTRDPKRKWAVDMINVLSTCTYNSLLSAGVTRLKHEQISVKMQEVFLHLYKKNAIEGEDETNHVKEQQQLPSSRLDKAIRLYQRIIAGDIQLKQQSNIASVLSLANPQKRYILQELQPSGPVIKTQNLVAVGGKAKTKVHVIAPLITDPVNKNKAADTLDDKTVSYISKTFDDTIALADRAIDTATSKTLNPLLLAIAMRRHSLGSRTIDSKSALTDTSKKRVRPVLENSMRMLIRTRSIRNNINFETRNEKSNNANSYVCQNYHLTKLFRKIYTHVLGSQNAGLDADVTYAMITDFEHLVYVYGLPTSKSTIDVYLDKHRAMLLAHQRSPEEFKFPLVQSKQALDKVSADNLHVMHAIGKAAVNDLSSEPFLCECNSWARLADLYVVEKSVDYIKKKSDFTATTHLKKVLTVAGWLLDLVVFVSVLCHHGVPLSGIIPIIHKIVPVSTVRATYIEGLVRENIIIYPSKIDRPKERKPRKNKQNKT